tara:strand:+ start:15339 stop:15557 length:219 start_codon:yes stop_codon:yes gene_type:complete
LVQWLAIAGTRVLAELKGMADEIPNHSILVNATTLLEAKDSSEIENIVTPTIICTGHLRPKPIRPMQKSRRF